MYKPPVCKLKVSYVATQNLALAQVKHDCQLLHMWLSSLAQIKHGCQVLHRSSMNVKFGSCWATNAAQLCTVRPYILVGI